MWWTFSDRRRVEEHPVIGSMVRSGKVRWCEITENRETSLFIGKYDGVGVLCRSKTRD
jgi:hypothetical protein